MNRIYLTPTKELRQMQIESPNFRIGEATVIMDMLLNNPSRYERVMAKIWLLQNRNPLIFKRFGINYFEE